MYTFATNFQWYVTSVICCKVMPIIYYDRKDRAY